MLRRWNDKGNTTRLEKENEEPSSRFTARDVWGHFHDLNMLERHENVPMLPIAWSPDPAYSYHC